MKRSEHYEDIILNQEDATTQDEDDDLFDENDLDREAWEDWNSQDMLNVYFEMVEQCESIGLGTNKTYNDFCNLMFEFRDSEFPLRDSTCDHLKNQKILQVYKGVDFACKLNGLEFRVPYNDFYDFLY
jgi:hypothetical protein